MSDLTEQELYDQIVQRYTCSDRYDWPEWVDSPFTMKDLEEVFSKDYLNDFASFGYYGIKELYWVVADNVDDIVNDIVNEYKKRHAFCYTPDDSPGYDEGATVIIPIKNPVNEEMTRHFGDRGIKTFEHYSRSSLVDDPRRYNHMFGVTFKNGVVVYPKRIVYVSTKRCDKRGRFDTFTKTKRNLVPDGVFVKKIGKTLIVKDGYDKDNLWGY